MRPEITLFNDLSTSRELNEQYSSSDLKDTKFPNESKCKKIRLFRHLKINQCKMQIQILRDKN